jgi:hypothetical protein
MQSVPLCQFQFTAKNSGSVAKNREAKIRKNLVLAYFVRINTAKNYHSVPLHPGSPAYIVVASFV